MADIFLSYASPDRERAKVLAQALAELGWSVWWDRTIPSGKRFDQVIAEALAGARCILVLWSAKSVTSDWVIEEAEEGRRREILIPAFIESTPPPMGFRRIQGADLADWNGSVTSPLFRSLAADIEALVGAPIKMKAEVGEIVETKAQSESRVAEQERKPIHPFAPPKRSDVPTSNISHWGSQKKTILAAAVLLALTVSVGYGVKLWYDQAQARLPQEPAAEEARRKEQEKLPQEPAAEEARRKEQERLAQQRAAEAARRKEQERLAQQRVVRRSAFRPPEAGRLYYYDIDAATQVRGSDNEVDFWFKADNPQDPNSMIGVLPVNGAKYAPRSAGLFPWELDESSFTSSQGVYPVPQRQDIPCFTSKKQPCTFRLQRDPGGELLVSFVLYR